MSTATTSSKMKAKYDHVMNTIPDVYSIETCMGLYGARVW